MREGGGRWHRDDECDVVDNLFLLPPRPLRRRFGEVFLGIESKVKYRTYPATLCTYLRVKYRILPKYYVRNPTIVGFPHFPLNSPWWEVLTTDTSFFLYVDRHT